MSRLNDLLRQLDSKDPALAKDLRREVEALTDRRAFGLNFERHMPETVELPGRKVRRGDKVRVLPPRGSNPTAENEKLWRVEAINRAAGTAALVPLVEEVGHDRLETEEVALEDLVVVAEFRDPIYPGLVSTGGIERGGDAPFHTVIKAENHHALQTLLFTHRGQVDCIYIDPPYNTGNDGWIYNDKYVAGDDLYKHSKWLAFMERRLLLAKELLRPTGVIIVAIGDEEHHRLRMLMDQVFGQDNFLADVVWQGGRKNDAKYVSVGADYMLIYAKDERVLQATGTRWRERKPGIDEALAAANNIWREAKGDHTAATRAWRSWMKKFKEKGVASDSVTRFVTLDTDGRPIRTDGNIRSPNPRPNLQYDLIHPVTGQPVKMHPNGWAYERGRMEQLVNEGRIVFGPDHSVTANMKRFLDESDDQPPLGVFAKERAVASKHLGEVLGERRFPNPKDVSVVSRWLGLVMPTQGVVLDFFGGSGSTAEAVMRLNAEDGGTRRCILVTNNEVAAAEAKALRKDGHRPGDPAWEAKGVYDYVAKPRIKTVVSGVRPDGSTYSEGLEQNVEFFDLTYEAPLRIATNRDFARVAPLLWMRAGSQGRRIDDLETGWDVADTYGVIEDLDRSEPFLKAVAAGGEKVRLVFVITDEDRLFQTLCRELPDHVEPVRLHEAYLRNFEIESGRSSR